MTFVVYLAGLVLTTLLFRFRLRLCRAERPWLTAVLTQVCAVFLGVILSKAVYVLCQIVRLWPLYGFASFIQGDINQFSFVGLAFGMLLGARLFLNLINETTTGTVDTVNLYAPCWALMLAFVRFGEHFGEHAAQLYGVGSMVENPAHMFFPLAQGNPNYPGEWFYAVFMLECLIALLAGLVTMGVQRISKISWDKGFSAERLAFYLALLQIFCQSLRANDANKWLFARAEQVLCAAVCLGLILRYSHLTRKAKHEAFSLYWLLPALGTVLGILILVFVEFALDKPYYFNDISRTACYIVMGAGLCVMAAMEFWSAVRRSRYALRKY